MSNFYFIKDDSCIFFLMGITCYKNDSGILAFYDFKLLISVELLI